MKKILVLIISLLLITSCNKTNVEKDDRGLQYINKIKEYKTREKNISNTTDNEEFDKFLDKVFAESMENDFMNFHYTVIDYKSFNIEKPPVDLGEIKYGFDEENFKYMSDQLAELQAFDYNSLSYRQQYDYEALEYSLYETLADYCYYKYNFLFSSGSNLAEDLVSNFTDYTFYDEESIEDYLTCLKDVDRYFDDALEYTKKQSEDGLGLIDPWVDYTVDAAKGVLNKVDDNTLIVTFDDRMDQLSFIDETKKQEYKQQNKQIVIDEVLPAYEKVLNEIEKYRGKEKTNDYALYKLNKNYAELVYILQGSNNANMDDVFQMMKDHLSYLEAGFVSCYYNQDSFDKYSKAVSGGIESMNLSGRDCLEFLRNNLNQYYPDLGDVAYDVQELDPDTAPSTAIAYYWPSPIDNHNQNIIRTNPNNMVAGYETYGTLAHEGFPGHLYQHVFYNKINPHNFRTSIGFTGYTEGWAVDAQRYAYQFSGIEDLDAAFAVNFEDTYYFALYSLIDMGVNYFGWTAKDISKYFESESMLFQFDEANAESIRQVLIEMPGLYCPYGIGSANFAELENYAKNELQDKFDYIKYHEVLLKNGPLPFNILKTAVDEYVNANQ